MIGKQNLELEKKYKTSASFMKQMANISKKFQEFEQQAYYSQLQSSSKNMIVTLLADSESSKKVNNGQTLDYFIFLGLKQPSGNKSIEKTVLNIIHLLPRPKKPFSIIYVNTLAAKNSFDDFKKVTEFLPIQYFLNLNKIYVLNASFLSKATSWISFNILTSFVKQKTIHVNDFKQLAESTNLNANQLIQLLPQQIQKELAKKEIFVDQIMNHSAMKMFNLLGYNQIAHFQAKQSKQEKKQQIKHEKEGQQFNPAVFKSSVMFASAKKATKKHLEDYQVGQTGAPLPLQMLIYYFKQRDSLLNTEGIFRKSVSIDDQNQLLAELEDGNYDYIETVSDPHLIANGIKRFLAYLVLPIVPYPQYMKMMQAPADKLTQTVVTNIKGLQLLRKKTMLILLQFFMEQVIPKQNSNKMSVKNISIVVGPCLMHSEVSSIKDLFYSQKIIAVMLVIFKEFDTIFGNKKERVLALRKSAKDFNRAYLQDKLGKFGSPITEPNVELAIPVEELVLPQSNFSKKQHKQQKESSSTKFKLIRRMTDCLKQQLFDSGEKIEDQQFEDLVEDENSKQVMQKIRQSIVDLTSAKFSEQEFIDI